MFPCSASISTWSKPAIAQTSTSAGSATGTITPAEIPPPTNRAFSAFSRIPTSTLRQLPPTYPSSPPSPRRGGSPPQRRGEVIPSRQPPPIDREGPAVEVRRILAAQEGHERGDLLGLAVTPQRYERAEATPDRFRIGGVVPFLDRLHHLRLDEAG